MFNLESSITAWRQQMLAAGIQSPVPLDELELHLREEMETQLSSGANAEQAFALAAQKIGGAPALKMEFSKTETVWPGKGRERWLVAVVCFGLIIPLDAYSLFKNDLSPAWRLLGFANLAVFLLVVFGCARLNRMFPLIPNRRTRTLIGLSFGLAGMGGMIAFTYFVLPHFTLTLGQLLVVFLWGMTLMAALGAVWAGLEETARRNINTSRT